MIIIVRTALLEAALIVAGNPGVYAQSENKSLMLEEVIVTATKRASNLQDVAVAVTALGAEVLQDAQINRDGVLGHLVVEPLRERHRGLPE